MKSLFWIVLGILGALAGAWIISAHSIFYEWFVQLLILIIWGALIGTAAFSRQGNFRDGARNAAIWMFVILILITGYTFRYDLKRLGESMLAATLPGSPRIAEPLEGRQRIVLTRSDDRHFHAQMKINGVPIRMLVDTGATTTVLTSSDAARVGVNPDNLSFTVPTSTANGLAFAARARVPVAAIGPIFRENMPVLVAKPEALNQSLLGMNFLTSLHSFEFRGDQLYLTD